MTIHSRARLYRFLLIALLAVFAAGCGGGGGEDPDRSTLPPVDRGGDPEPSPSPRFTFSGRVLNSLGNPVPDAAVLLGGREARTDSRGRFEISQFTAGLFELTVAAEDEPLLSRRLSFAGSTEPVEIELPAPERRHLTPLTTSPELLSDDNPLNGELTITFNRELDPEQNLTELIRLEPGGAPFSASLSGTELSVVPARQLPPASRVRVTVDGALAALPAESDTEDTELTLGSPLVLAFRTAGEDTAPPKILSTSVGDEDGGVPRNPLLTVLLNEEPVSRELAATSQPPADWLISAVERRVSLRPESALEANTDYTVTLEGIRDANGNSAEPVTLEFTTSEETRAVSIRDPAWNRNAGRITFAADPEGSYDLFTVDEAGENLTRVTSAPGDEVSPSFSPDGELIAYQKELEGNDEVLLTSPGGNQPTRLTDNDAADRDPQFSRITDRILFTSDRGSDPTDPFFSLWRMSFDGSSQRPVERNLGFEVADPEHFPFSDDQVLVAARRRGQRDILNVSLDPDSELEINITAAIGGDHRSATIDRAGDSVAFVTEFEDAPPQVWTVDPDGSFPRQLTELEEGVAQVEYSPLTAGDRIAAVVPRSGGGDDLVMLDAQTGAVLETLVGGDDAFPPAP